MKTASLWKYWLAALLLLVTPWAWANDSLDTVRIGYQKYGTLMLLKERQALEKRFANQDVQVTWTEFPAGPQLLEALNVGSIDFGVVGETPPVFAQAAGANLVYVAHEPSAPAGEAIIVPKDSAIQSVKELKGKKVALNKGSNVHYLLVKALAAAGLSLQDIQPVYLPPADARAAFESNKVDAWVSWDPFLAAAEHALQARTIQSGDKLVNNYQYYIAAKPFADKAPKLLSTIVEEIQDLDKWAKGNLPEVAKILAPAIGQPTEVVLASAKRAAYDTQYLKADVVTYQQKIADTFTELGLIPSKLDVASVIWQPK